MTTDTRKHINPYIRKARNPSIRKTGKPIEVAVQCGKSFACPQTLRKHCGSMHINNG